MHLKRLTYLLVFLLCCTAASAQVKFEAKVSKKRLGVNERLRVDFEMNKDGDNFSPPDFKGFRVVGGPNQAISNSYINGKRSYSKTYSYFLAPTARGSFSISQATIEIEGQTYKTSPIAIQVTAAVDIPKNPNDPDYLATENVHLVAELSKTDPYINEAITVTYKLYVGDRVNITSNWREIDTPKYADFWSQNLDAKGQYKIYEGEYNGRKYRYVILRTTVLYPQKTGKLTLEPLTLDVPIDVKSNRRDLFGRPLMTRVNKTISAGNRTLNVKPLPLEGRPASFTGAVGDFELDVSTNKLELDATESLELSVKVSGNGNLKLFDLPSVKLPSSLEVYEPAREDNIKTQFSGMSGSIVEKYTIVPQYKGKYPLRPVTFSYFDPTTEKYTSITSEEIIVDVINGPVNAELATTETNPGGEKQTVVSTVDQFKFIKLNADLIPIDKENFFKSKLYWWLLLIPFAAIPIIIFIGFKRGKRRADIEGNKLRRATRLAKKYLSNAKKNLGNKTPFYEALERALHNYLKAKLTIETSELDKERISQLLSERNVGPEAVGEFKGLLQRCDYARYTPTDNVTMKQDYDTAVQTISSIDKQFSRA